MTKQKAYDALRVAQMHELEAREKAKHAWQEADKAAEALRKAEKEFLQVCNETN